jgi:hypothetical protein
MALIFDVVELELGQFFLHRNNLHFVTGIVIPNRNHNTIWSNSQCDTTLRQQGQSIV